MWLPKECLIKWHLVLKMLRNVASISPYSRVYWRNLNPGILQQIILKNRYFRKDPLSQYIPNSGASGPSVAFSLVTEEDRSHWSLFLHFGPWASPTWLNESPTEGKKIFFLEQSFLCSFPMDLFPVFQHLPISEGCSHTGESFKTLSSGLGAKREQQSNREEFEGEKKKERKIFPRENKS